MNDLLVPYEDTDIAVVVKPEGLAVHPGAGEREATLVDFLKKRFSSLSVLPGEERPGIVHRLDKDTSGLLLVAKTDLGYECLTSQMKKGSIQKFYQALVCGHLEPKTGTIDAPIGRSFSDRKKMSALTYSGRRSVTHYRVQEYFSDLNVTLVELRLETGRTHQIRVHMKAIKFPVVGDLTYGRREMNKLFHDRFGLDRQFLHAYKLEFVDIKGKKRLVQIELPDAFQTILKSISR
ncbi:MAG: RluA family pseudouridine synthase [Patescibacteria group bacterium]